MSHDNQPVRCYQCERAAERWRISFNPKTMAWEIEVDCHGEMDLVVIRSSEGSPPSLPIVAFKPPEALICPTKALLGFA